MTRGVVVCDTSVLYGFITDEAPAKKAIRTLRHKPYHSLAFPDSIFGEVSGRLREDGYPVFKSKLNKLLTLLEEKDEGRFRVSTRRIQEMTVDFKCPHHDKHVVKTVLYLEENLNEEWMDVILLHKNPRDFGEGSTLYGELRKRGIKVETPETYDC